jgi:hypothetical protein
MKPITTIAVYKTLDNIEIYGLPFFTLDMEIWNFNTSFNLPADSIQSISEKREGKGRPDTGENEIYDCTKKELQLNTLIILNPQFY